MNLILPFGLILWTFANGASTQNTGLTCRDCKDIASPNDCRSTLVCGQDEICYTREFTDNKGLKGFHVGCEDKNTCSLMIPALTIFGKRDTSNVSTVSPHNCFQCCSTDECNAALCDGSTGGHPSQVITSAGVTCKACKEAASPEDCRESMICGQGEICYTREFIDYDGLQGFSMGCEAKMTCELLVKVNTLFGKRDNSDANPRAPCYECCSGDNCNTDLCSGSVLDHPSSIVPSHIGCPANFIGIFGYCYYVVPRVTTYWTRARAHCQGLGSDLLSIHSKLEHWFLRWLMIVFSDNFISHFWTGGYYAHAARQWEYVDGTPFDFTNWWRRSPPSYYSHDTDYYALILNPRKAPTDPIYRNALMVHTNLNERRFGIFCKKRRNGWTVR